MSATIPFNSSSVRAGECVSQSIELIKPRFFLYVGICLLGVIISGCIPCISIFLAGPISVGIYYTLFREMRGQDVDFGMMFKGFEKFLPAMVIGIIQKIPAIISQVAQYTGNVADILGKMRGGAPPRSSGAFSQSLQADPNFALAGGMVLIIIVIVLVFLLFSLAWSIGFNFALPLIAEYDLSIGEAISLSFRAGWSNAGGLILLGIFQFFIALAGALVCLIGLFFVMPIIYASSAVAFRQVFPDTQQFFNNEPPRPEAYGASYGNPMR